MYLTRPLDLDMDYEQFISHQCEMSDFKANEFQNLKVQSKEA